MGRASSEDAGLEALSQAISTLGLRDVTFETANGKTIIRGVARHQLDREQLYETIKQIDGWEEHILVDVEVESHEVRGYHTVRRGETLASIAERYLGSAGRDRAIFAANRDRMNDPDQIFPGQQLLIPWR